MAAGLEKQQGNGQAAEAIAGAAETDPNCHNPSRWLFLAVSSDGERIAVQQLATMGGGLQLEPKIWDTLSPKHQKAALYHVNTLASLLGAPTIDRGTGDE